MPGSRGRLAATAQVVRGTLLLFGGYTVDSGGRERSLSNVDIFDPSTNDWKQGAPIPVAVDDAVSGVFRDSLVYLVSGWHDTDNVQDVQIYDVARDRWSIGTPTPGPGVFGHTGSLAGNTIVYVDGAVRQASGPKYRLVRQTWIGVIDSANPAAIRWKPGPLHPVSPIYRAAAASCGPYVVIAGGTANPYNYDGIGYDGQPSEPRTDVSSFDIRTGAWQSLPPLPTASMDHRGLARIGTLAWTVGGMRTGQRVSAATDGITLGICAR